jgi:hypothetical protein
MIVHCLYCVGNFTENLIGIYSTPEKAQEISSKMKELQSILDPEYFAYSSCEFYIIQKELDVDNISILESGYNFLKEMDFKLSRNFYVLSIVHSDTHEKNVIGVFSHKHELNNAINAYKDKYPLFFSTGGTFEEKEFEVNKI